MLALTAAVVGAALSPARPLKARVAIVGGGFAGLTAARKLAAQRDMEVLLLDQRSYFEYTPGILRAWVDPDVHRRLVNPVANLLPLKSGRARFRRVMPSDTAQILERETRGAEPLALTVTDEHGQTVLEYPCDYVVLATGGELGPVADDRQTSDGSVAARRARLREQVGGVLDNAAKVLIVGGGLTGVELAAECAERFGKDAVTLAVGPTLAKRGAFPGDAGEGILPGFADTRTATGARGESGAVAYTHRWLERAGVRVLKRWAVPPPAVAASAASATFAASECVASELPSCGWRDGGDGERALAWEAGSDLEADAVFDCRGLRPNNARSYGVRDAYGARPNMPIDGVRRDGATAGGVGGLPADVVDVSGWLIVDERFRLSRPRRATGSVLERQRAVFEAAYGGRVYCCGDAACKDKQERTAANAHAEGEYVALDILHDARGKRPLAPYVKPLRLTAVSLGKRDGVVVLGAWVALRGWLAAIAKQAIQWWFVNFLPLPYWLLRRLPGRLPRKPYEVLTRFEYDAA